MWAKNKNFEILKMTIIISGNELKMSATYDFEIQNRKNYIIYSMDSLFFSPRKCIDFQGMRPMATTHPMMAPMPAITPVNPTPNPMGQSLLFH